MEAFDDAGDWLKSQLPRRQLAELELAQRCPSSGRKLFQNVPLAAPLTLSPHSSMLCNHKMLAAVLSTCNDMTHYVSPEGGTYNIAS